MENYCKAIGLMHTFTGVPIFKIRYCIGIVRILQRGILINNRLADLVTCTWYLQLELPFGVKAYLMLVDVIIGTIHRGYHLNHNAVSIPWNCVSSFDLFSSIYFRRRSITTQQTSLRYFNHKAIENRMHFKLLQFK